MSIASLLKRYTPADLLSMPDGGRFELIDGELVEVNMSTWSSFVAGGVYGRLRPFSDNHSLGWVFPEGTSYQCFPHVPDRVRRADASFIRKERLSVAQATAEGHLTIAPDLAVEVLSPNDLAYDVHAKVQDYLRARVRLVWVISPDVHFVDVYRLDGSGVILREEEELSGEDVLPGFRCRVGDLFQLPPGVTAE